VFYARFFGSLFYLYVHAPVSVTRREPCVKHTAIYGVPLLTDNTMKKRNSNLLEIMYNIRTDGSYNVFHAMKCRKEFYHLAEESDYYV